MKAIMVRESCSSVRCFASVRPGIKHPENKGFVEQGVEKNHCFNETLAPESQSQIFGCNLCMGVGQDVGARETSLV